VAARHASPRSTAPIFNALGEETRLRLVARLCGGGPQSISRLTAGSRVTRQAVTKHLHVLAGAGLVKGVRIGRESRWELETARLRIAQRYLARIAQQWSERLSSLERHLDAMSEPVDSGDSHSTWGGRSHGPRHPNRPSHGPHTGGRGSSFRD
jgi:DNA-binding transcriptional ArsR family regulator